MNPAPNQRIRSATGFGLDYEFPVSAARAHMMLGGGPLPRMGYEVDVKRNYEQPPGVTTRVTTGQLTLQNISGHLYLASCTHAIDQWKEVFGVELPEFAHV